MHGAEHIEFFPLKVHEIELTPYNAGCGGDMDREQRTNTIWTRSCPGGIGNSLQFVFDPCDQVRPQRLDQNLKERN